MLRIAAALALVVAVLVATDRPAQAFPQFQKVFVAEYTEGTDNEEYAKLVKEAKCFVCHQGKKKKNRNPYGDALNEFLDKGDKKDVEKITEALQKVAEMPSVADDEESPTFGELIAEGKLPGGDLETVKEEPSDE